MHHLELNYLTWERTDANGLFDYQQQMGVPNTLSLYEAGYLFRKKDDYSLQFVKHSNLKKYQNKQICEKLMTIKMKDAHFFIFQAEKSNQLLWKIISDVKNNTHILQENQTIKLGKAIIKILTIQYVPNNKIVNHYEISQNLKKPRLSNITKITQSFYSNLTESKSVIQNNPSCRYCHAKSISQSNPFIVSCKCSGSSKYLHEQCLIQWILKRGRIQQNKDRDVYISTTKLFTCELCHQLFDILPLFTKVLKIQKQQQKTQNFFPPKQLIILRINNPEDLLYFINISKSRQIQIGRSLQCQVVLNQLSVSRKHSIIRVERQNNRIVLKDNNAKFGTLVHIKCAQVGWNQEVYQIGRSKMIFKKIKTKNFLERIGFCFVQENMKRQQKKI